MLERVTRARGKAMKCYPLPSGRSPDAAWKPGGTRDGGAEKDKDLRAGERLRLNRLAGGARR
jgi:hypothetical protein